MFTLIESIYATVQDPALWAGVMDGLNVALEGDTLALFASFPGKACNILGISEMPAEVWEAFAQYYATINPIMPRCEAMLSPDETWFSHRVISTAEMRGTECGNDYYLPQRMDYFAGIRLKLGGEAVANLSCQRSARRGEFDEKTDSVYRTLRPHLQRALLLHEQFGNLQAQTLALSSALEAFDHAVFVLDGEGRVVYSNRHAELLALSGDALSPAQGRLAAWDATTNRELQRLLAGVIAAGSGLGLSAGGSMILPRRRRGGSLHLTATPFPTREIFGSQPVAALVFVRDPSSVPLSRAGILRALYRLTAAECRIAELLMGGLETREIASRLRITLETARSHVKRILAKTGVSRQSQLVRLLMSLPGGLNEMVKQPGVSQES